MEEETTTIIIIGAVEETVMDNKLVMRIKTT